MSVWASVEKRAARRRPLEEERGVMNRLLSDPSSILPFPRLEYLTSRNIPPQMSDPVLGQEFPPYPVAATLAPDFHVWLAKKKESHGYDDRRFGSTR